MAAVLAIPVAWNAHGQSLAASTTWKEPTPLERPFPGAQASCPHGRTRAFGPLRAGRPRTQGDGFPERTCTEQDDELKMT